LKDAFELIVLSVEETVKLGINDGIVTVTDKSFDIKIKLFVELKILILYPD